MKKKFKIIIEKEEKCELNCYSVHIPIYDLEIKILNKVNTSKLNKLWKRDENYSMMTEDFLSKNNFVLITIVQYSDHDIVHEIHHAVDMIMNHIGHKKNKESDEPSAYLMTYLYKEIIKLKKYLKK